MENDTRTMTCEQAEDELSGYLDDVLDPQLRRNVDAHLASCDRCQALLADFRRADEMLRTLPFIEPPPGMHDRFFHSPRYLKQASAQAHPRSVVRPLTAALVAAAMLVVALGGALLFRQSLFVSQQAHSTGTTTTIGNPGGVVPLPAGSRLIYERGGALWSAPESGAGLPQQLTPGGIQVAGWSVSPSGRMVIYIDARTGALHAIRADALDDTVIGRVTGGQTPAPTFWTTSTGAAIAGGISWSPDTTRLAYLTQRGAGVELHVMNATGAADVAVSAGAGAALGQPLWSADSVSIAYTASRAGSQSIWAYNVTTGHAQRLAAQSDPADAAAVVGRLAWLPGQTSAALTWSALDKRAVTGVFLAEGASDSAIRLTPAGASYAAADISTSGGWLLANGPTLSEIAAGEAAPQVVTTLASPIAQVVWAPSGTTAAVVAGDTLSLLTPDRRLIPVAHGLTTPGRLAWSPDSATLAWQANGGVMSAQLHQGTVSAPRMVASVVNASALVWSPDGQSLAIRSATGLSLVSSDGAHVRATDGHAASSGGFAWSLAG